MDRARILVVEDHDPLRRLYTRTLDRAGFEAVAVPDGCEALEAAGRERSSASCSTSTCLAHRATR